MGVSERREREREEVRRKILDAARELFTGEGYDASRCGASPRPSSTPPPPSTTTSRTRTTSCSRCAARTSAACWRVLEEPALARRSRWSASGSSGRAYARFGLEHPNHYRFMFMAAAKPEHKPEPTDPGVRSFGVLRAAVDRGDRRRAPSRRATWTRSPRSSGPSVHGAVALLITFRPDSCPAGPPATDLVEQTMENGDPRASSPPAAAA